MKRVVVVKRAMLADIVHGNFCVCIETAENVFNKGFNIVLFFHCNIFKEAIKELSS